MEIFGVGPLEFILFLVLALIILGPEDMVGTARKMGQWVYRVVRSPTWRSILATSQDLRELPQKLVREAGLEDTMKEIKQTADEVKTDLSDTTREINAEMQAATSEVTREMQTAVQDVNAGMNEASAEAQVAMQSTAAGLSGGENTIAPPQAQAAAVLDEAAPAPEKEPRLDPYEVQLETIATGLGGKVIQRAEPEELAALRVTPAENTVPTAPAPEPQAEAAPKQPYEAGLETFAQALGAPTSSPRETVRPNLESQAPVETEPAPPPWAIGIPAGLNLDAGGMEARFKKQMDEMIKSIEKLDAKIKPAGEAETPASLQAEEGTPPSGQVAQPGNGVEPAAAPTRVRRNAKRTAPAEDADKAEAPKAAPRKRAVKTALPAAEADIDAAPKAAPRKRAAKTTSPAAEAAEGEAPKTAPRKRAAKKTPAAETADQGSVPAQI